MNLQLILYSCVYALCNVCGAAIIKSEIKLVAGLNNVSDYISLLLKWKIILGFAIIFSSSLVLFKALSLFEFTKVIPISIGVNFVLTTLVGVIIFSETVNTYGAVGMIIIVIGIILLNMN
jgi:multidrug transporter EmrE-like cation transporter